jgi:lipopolysaccharide transport system ATP-binding protein
MSSAAAPRPEPEAQPVVLRCDRLGKAFRRFDQQPFLVRNLLLRLVGRAPERRELWPFRDVSFEVRRGETVGIIGRNGAGKSTLLRILAGSCFPTEGTLSVRGRVAPLLGIGAGFQPDMTGAECIAVNATILGLGPRELEARMEAIVAFADLGDFLHTPMRYYSTGMTARLGFAVAMETSADLVLIDEVLAVGDHAFQRKCLARIDELRATGVTLLLVSHSTELVRTLCDRVLWLRDGRLVADGAPEPILAAYLAG